MAEVEWIKFQIDMFDNRKIKRIRKLPDGNNIVLIWIMLLTRAGAYNADGLIFLTDTILYDRESLADELRFEPAQIVLALDVLKTYGMIIYDDSELRIKNWEEYQNVEGLEKIRESKRLAQARWREKQKVLSSAVDSAEPECRCSTVDSTEIKSGNAEEDLDKNKNKEIETEGDIEKEKHSPEAGDEEHNGESHAEHDDSFSFQTNKKCFPSHDKDPLGYWSYMTNFELQHSESRQSLEFFQSRAKSQGIEIVILKDPETGEERAETKRMAHRSGEPGAR